MNSVTPNESFLAACLYSIKKHMHEAPEFCMHYVSSYEYFYSFCFEFLLYGVSFCMNDVSFSCMILVSACMIPSSSCHCKRKRVRRIQISIRKIKTWQKLTAVRRILLPLGWRAAAVLVKVAVEESQGGEILAG